MMEVLDAILHSKFKYSENDYFFFHYAVDANFRQRLRKSKKVIS